jgi:hypothetical protein
MQDSVVAVQAGHLIEFSYGGRTLTWGELVGGYTG